MLKRIFALALGLVMAASLMVPAMAAEPDTKVPEELQVSQLYMVLPDWISTPDGMTIDKDGNLILACPNFGDQTLPGCIARITPAGEISKWFDVPVDAESGVARPMGVEFGPDGSLWIVDNQGWTGNPESVNHGRILKVSFDDKGEIASTTEVAVGMEHPNGIKIKGNYAYVTQSSMTPVEDPSGKLVSAVYRFPLDAEGIKVTNTLDDENILAAFITENPACQYGLDGLVFDKAGNLYVGNFGDGAISRITFNADDSVASNEIWAQDSDNLVTTDGMCIDDNGNIFVADFNRNAIARVTPDGKVSRIAQSPDSTGANGELDQPGEPIVWNNMLLVSCFDMVTDDGKINSAHDAPQTMAWISLDIANPPAQQPEELAFTDVNAGQWFEAAVRFVCGKGYMKGVSDTSFNPTGTITGAEVTQILYNKEGTPAAADGASFQGVDGRWYAPAMLWAAGQGIVTDSGETAIDPAANVTREQIALMLYNYLGTPEGTADLGTFSDAEQVSSWAKAAMEWAVSAKVFQGSGGKLNPTGTATRAEVAQLLMNYFG